jgi:hypothetical protein
MRLDTSDCMDSLGCCLYHCCCRCSCVLGLCVSYAMQAHFMYSAVTVAQPELGWWPEASLTWPYALLLPPPWLLLLWQCQTCAA